MSTTQLGQAAVDLADRLRETGRRVVFAESCTAGLIAASLGEVPGISEHLCGSAVVYRNAAKSAWLDVPITDLEDPSVGAVSPEVASAMATGVLERTPEADVAASVTGDLGPNAPAETDGRAFVGLATRTADGVVQLVSVDEIRLSRPETAESSLDLRRRRQREAAARVLEMTAAAIQAEC